MYEFMFVVAIPTMVSLFFFGCVFELTQISCQRHPERWGLEVDAQSKRALRSSVPFHHIVMNRIYDHPWLSIAAAGTPLAAFILSQQLKMKHLTLSQKVMHSRVYAQAGILTIGLGTLAFREYMDRHGRFPEDVNESTTKPTTEDRVEALSSKDSAK